jgi:hypothetical protein
MLLQSRLRRLEQKHMPENPLEDLTDEELDAAIHALDVQIRLETGEESAALADRFERQMEAKELPDELDEASVRAFVRSVKAGGMVHAYRTR